MQNRHVALLIALALSGCGDSGSHDYSAQTRDYNPRPIEPPSAPPSSQERIIERMGRRIDARLAELDRLQAAEELRYARARAEEAAGINADPRSWLDQDRFRESARALAGSLYTCRKLATPCSRAKPGLQIIANALAACADNPTQLCMDVRESADALTESLPAANSDTPQLPDSPLYDKLATGNPLIDLHPARDDYRWDITAAWLPWGKIFLALLAALALGYGAQRAGAARWIREWMENRRAASAQDEDDEAYDRPAPPPRGEEAPTPVQARANLLVDRSWLDDPEPETPDPLAVEAASAEAEQPETLPPPITQTAEKQEAARREQEKIAAIVALIGSVDTDLKPRRRRR
ncbi:hypothetical protein [Crenobacter intestini]|uniref:Uncharacterized protein n=1 Tax=Crenobacter intestini TaxID=2563443 RepID=A0A4T0UIX3_9NEIS|nr:hypothetical protein [Crenobacter intestini]TIC78484.1 hypothetical protein E5K04_16025 [Crenobacter intestini]